MGTLVSSDRGRYLKLASMFLSLFAGQVAAQCSGGETIIPYINNRIALQTGQQWNPKVGKPPTIATTSCSICTGSQIRNINGRCEANTPSISDPPVVSSGCVLFTSPEERVFFPIN
jgi:hypothetical protein